jgi:phosphoglycerol transferase MdoB-like AlkP superfamily enzyme
MLPVPLGEWYNTFKKGSPVLNVPSTQRCFGLLRQIIKLQLLFLLLLTLSRVAFYSIFSPQQESFTFADLADAFFLGFRIDLVLVAYLFAVPLLAMVVANLLRTCLPLRFVRGYFITVYLLASALIGIDFAFYSYFGEHTSIMIFGFFDDDTAALIQIGLKNYNIPLIVAAMALYTVFITWLVRRFFRDIPAVTRVFSPFKGGMVYLVLILLMGVSARGSLGLFPLLKDIPEVSTDPFVSALPRNGVFEFEKSLEQYIREKSGRPDLIKRTGYSGKMEQAFRDYLGRADINGSDLAGNLVRTTPENPAAAQKPPHVVVVMVESFGAPILRYQSPEFDIMRRLKKHFDSDIVFTNFISGANGTIVSLEPILLNLVSRPASVSYGQSRYLGTEFPQAAARVYQRAGYETNFLYGGDLSWRNVGRFFKRQGFDHVEGKSNIKALFPDAEEHDYGVYDKHTYDFVIQKLQHAKRPQFVFILTTNNHPPYTISRDYDSKPLALPEALKKHVTGDMSRARLRLQDYQYALDMAGRFMDEIKGSSLSENTAVAITADNNTIEGIMYYDHPMQESKRVPFYLYLPPYLKSEPYDRNVSASHNDLFPTLYGRTLSEVSFTALGRDLYDPSGLHCGFNNAGVIMSDAGAFKHGHAHTAVQRACDKQYGASLAVTEYLILQAFETSKAAWSKGDE